MNKNLISRQDLLHTLDSQALAVESGPNSALGRRRAYENLVIQQRQTNDGICNITLFNLLTSYNIRSALLKDKGILKQPSLITINDKGIVNTTKEIQKFIVGDNVYTKLRKDAVVNLCPYIPLDPNDERSCYSIILMHTVWPIEGERNLLSKSLSATERLAEMKICKLIPAYVIGTLARYHVSQTLQSNISQVQNVNHKESNIDDENTMEEPMDTFEQIIHTEYESTIHPPLNYTEDMEIISNISPGNKIFYVDFIQNSQTKYLNKLALENQQMDSNATEFNAETLNHYVEINDYTERLQTLESNVLKLTTKQLLAYKIAVQYINGNKGKQMLMFVSGEGGTGKSFLISLLMEYTRIYHGKQKGLYGSALAIAPTGAAANVIKGFNWQSVYGVGLTKKN